MVLRHPAQSGVLGGVVNKNAAQTLLAIAEYSLAVVTQDGLAWLAAPDLSHRHSVGRPGKNPDNG